MGRPRDSSKYRKEIKLGQKFGSWTVYDFVMSEGKGRSKVAVKCECGNKSHVPAYDLVHKRSTQCKECSKGQSPTIFSLSNRTRKVYQSAIGKGLAYTINSAYLSESFLAQSHSCALTGAPITPQTAMAVRIDNAGGLTPDNTVLVLNSVGTTLQKSGMDAATFYGLAQSVTQNIQQSGTGNTVKDFFTKRETE